MEIRGIHIDLKAQMMRFDYLKRTVRELADMGFNTLLLEYQDKFPYTGELACLAAPDALTEAEIQELKALCRSLGMQIIPMVQCIGHMYWVTRFPPFAPLGEHYGDKGPGSHSLCPSMDGSFALFQALCSQVFRLHPERGYFHIGGDEVKFSDNCPRCHNKSQGELLGSYYRKVLSHIEDSGYTPVMWGDMVVKYPQISAFLPKGTLIMDWEYHTGLTRDHQTQFYRDIAPLNPPSDTPFSNTPKLTAQGFQVLTAPALRSMGDSCFLPRPIHLDNCVEAFYTAQEHSAKGIMVTSWAVRRSPWCLTKPVLSVIAALFRTPGATFSSAIAAYARQAFGKDVPALGLLPFLLGQAVLEAQKSADFLSSGQDFMDPETGMFLSDSLEKRLGSVDIRDNAVVIAAYEKLNRTASDLKQQLMASGSRTEDAQMLLWALENALFLSRYVTELCRNYADPEWLQKQLALFDEFRSQVAQLSRYYTDFSLPSEYQSRIDIHKAFLEKLLENI